MCCISEDRCILQTDFVYFTSYEYKLSRSKETNKMNVVLEHVCVVIVQIVNYKTVVSICVNIGNKKVPLVSVLNSAR